MTENCKNEIKKWMYSKPIPFDKYVFIDRERSGQSVTLTWKMVIKYWEGLFFVDDLIIFDETLIGDFFIIMKTDFTSGRTKSMTKNLSIKNERT